MGFDTQETRAQTKELGTCPRNSNTLSKYFPGGNGLSQVHDITGNYLSSKLGGTVNGLFFNFQTMPIAYGLNAAGSPINDAPGLIGVYQHYKDEF